MIGILNYGMGNIRSVRNALDYAGIPNRIITDFHDVKTCDKLILPGVGAFGLAMEQLAKLGFLDEIKEHSITRRKSILGICLGMQLLFETSSEHGQHDGLAFVKGKVNYLGDKVMDLPIPHIGWNEVLKRDASTLLNGIEEKGSFYFVHNYYCESADESTVTGKVEYGISFDAVLEAENVFGCQFHPEKSQKNGLAVLKNFWKA